MAKPLGQISGPREFIEAKLEEISKLEDPQARAGQLMFWAFNILLDIREALLVLTVQNGAQKANSTDSGIIVPR